MSRGYAHLRMIAIGTVLAVTALPVSVGGSPADTPAGENGSRFETVDIFIAGDTPLAAYQIEVIVDGQASVVGVEGGVAPFVEPPLYDPAALAGGRIIIAAYDVVGALPAGRHRVATLHMHIAGGSVDYRIAIQAAAGVDGRRIVPAPTAEFSLRKELHR